MRVIFVTGMSGTGKSASLDALAGRGYRVVDTDRGDWITEDETGERLWREDRIEALLSEHGDGPMFVSGCVMNQGKFYDRFHRVVLLSAPVEVILARVATRETNTFGKTEAERARIASDLGEFEPRLRAGADTEIDTRASVDEVADMLESLAAA